MEPTDHREDAGVAVVAVGPSCRAGLDEAADVLLEAHEQRPRFRWSRQGPALVVVLRHDATDGECGERDLDGALGEMCPGGDLGARAGMPAPQGFEEPAAQRATHAADQRDGIGEASGGAGAVRMDRVLLERALVERALLEWAGQRHAASQPHARMLGIGTLYVFVVRRT